MEERSPQSRKGSTSSIHLATQAEHNSQLHQRVQPPPMQNSSVEASAHTPARGRQGDGDAPLKIVADGEDYCQYESRSHWSDGYKTFWDLFQSRQLLDVEISVADKTFKCHRIVMAAVSNYFRTMFTGDMSESRSEAITIRDIDPEAFEQLVLFAYTSRIKVSVEKVQTLLYASSILQVESVASACCEFMKTHLHPSNCIGIKQFADLHGRAELSHKAEIYAIENFLAVCDSDEFVTMTGEQLLYLVKSDRLNVNSEEQVYEAVLKWIKHDLPQRESFLSVLLGSVKLALLEPSFLRNKVAQETLISRDFACRDLLDEARDYQFAQANMIGNDTSINTDKIRPRNACAGVIFCVGGRGACGDPFKTIECYDLRKDAWFLVAEMTTRRRHVGVVAAGKLYAIGGHDGNEHLATGEVFDPVTNRWSSIAPMATLRRGIALASIGSPIYAVGGLDDSTCFNVVERYDPASDRWQVVQFMNMPRGGVAVAVLKGFMYAIGGNDGAASLDTCERYDPHLDKWTNVASMNMRRAGAGAAELNGMIYVVGGFDDNAPLASVERYDASTDCWQMVTSMSCSRGGVGVAPLGGNIYAVGGHDGSNYLCSVESYNPQNDRWHLVSHIRSYRAGAGIAGLQCHVTALHDVSKLNQAGTAGHL